MDVIGVIPARYGSTRFEGKVLADILGKPMLQYVWESAKQARILDDLIIACDDQRIYDAAVSFGAKVVFTSKGHVCGTDRIAEVINPLDVKVIVNIQADEPLLEPIMIDKLARNILENDFIPMATLAKRIDNIEEYNDPNVVKVVADKNGFALYFSRSPIPYLRGDFKNPPVLYKHLGIYAYTKDFLFTFKNMPVSSLEEAEKLEQLRVLENGYKIKVVETVCETVGVDTPEDLEKAKEILSRFKKNG